jgi:hypothetical protein
MMATRYALEMGEQLLVDLASPDMYISHVNQVVAITDRRLVVVRSLLFRKDPITLQYFPLEHCTHVTYRRVLAVGALLGGLVLAAFGLLGIAVQMTGQLEQVRILGLFALMVVFGLALALGVKRHRLLFRVGDAQLRWQSAAGEYKHAIGAVGQVARIAHQSGIPLSGFPGGA